MNKSKYWISMLKIKKLVYHDYNKALDFHGSNLSIEDLELVYDKITNLSVKSELVSLRALEKSCTKYSNSQLDDLITRLKMLGEIYNPYYHSSKSNEGKFVKLL